MCERGSSVLINQSVSMAVLCDDDDNPRIDLHVNDLNWAKEGVKWI